MQLLNSRRAYGLVSVTVHWLSAGLIVLLLISGWIFEDLPRDFGGAFMTDLHFNLGILILALTVFRLLWRLASPGPAAEGPAWQARAATWMQWALLALLIVIPLTGWAMVSAAGEPMTLWGGTTLPALAPTSHSFKEAFEETHEVLAGGVMLTLLAVHVLAALKHHFLDRDETLARMTHPFGDVHPR